MACARRAVKKLLTHSEFGKDWLKSKRLAIEMTDCAEFHTISVTDTRTCGHNDFIVSPSIHGLGRQ